MSELQEEILSILKKHCVFRLEKLSWANFLFITECEDYEVNGGIDTTASVTLTDEEYEIIKKWLEEEEL